MGPHFSIFRSLRRSGTQRKHKQVSSDVPSSAGLKRQQQMQNVFGKIMVVVVFGLSLIKIPLKLPASPS